MTLKDLVNPRADRRSGRLRAAGAPGTWQGWVLLAVLALQDLAARVQGLWQRAYGLGFRA